MAILFDFYENPDSSGEKSGKYHARVVSLHTVKTNQICREIQEATSLTEGDVKAVLSALSHSIGKHLMDSNRIHLEGIGFFQPTLRSSREIDPNKTRSQSVWFKSVKFRADKELKGRLITAPTERSPFKNHSTNLSNEQVDKKVFAYLKINEYMTRKDMQQICGYTKSTAARHIKRMVEEGKIKNKNDKRYPLYVWI